jgi:hypothetical protein
MTLHILSSKEGEEGMVSVGDLLFVSKRKSQSLFSFSNEIGLYGVVLPDMNFLLDIGTRPDDGLIEEEFDFLKEFIPHSKEEFHDLWSFAGIVISGVDQKNTNFKNDSFGFRDNPPALNFKTLTVCAEGISQLRNVFPGEIKVDTNLYLSLETVALDGDIEDPYHQNNKRRNGKELVLQLVPRTNYEKMSFVNNGTISKFEIIKECLGKDGRCSIRQNQTIFEVTKHLESYKTMNNGILETKKTNVDNEIIKIPKRDSIDIINIGTVITDEYGVHNDIDVTSSRALRKHAEYSKFPLIEQFLFSPLKLL